MPKIIIISGVFLLLTVAVSGGKQSTSNFESKEVELIRTACMDYVEGWFDSNPARLKNGVHPDLVKRIPENNKLRETTREKLIESTMRKKDHKPEIVVEVFDVFKDIALAKVTSGFVDYVQLAKINGKWRVVNVLWQYL